MPPQVPESGKCDVIVERDGKSVRCDKVANNIHNLWWVCDDCLKYARGHGGFPISAFRKVTGRD
ncbi:MAG TPA: hypothetical protein VJZ03_01585 [Candidatus Bathyarchaeia archaeon]|nr:hypothetical protein [Candidatus Bathyarchaeia archaeon]